MSYFSPSPFTFQNWQTPTNGKEKMTNYWRCSAYQLVIMVSSAHKAFVPFLPLRVLSFLISARREARPSSVQVWFPLFPIVDLHAQLG
jgi:hypothetical protein